jgi:membrane protease YdiL (CAAX protease family)
MKTFVMRHPLAIYFALTFAISWGGVLFILRRSGAIPDPATQLDPLLPFVFVMMLAGPAVAGILLTGLVRGSAGWRACFASLIKWRVDARWYAIAVLTAPLLTMALLLTSSLVAPDFVPGILTTNDKPTLVLFGLAVGLMAGVFEELGWTGFAVSGLRPHYGVLATGLIVGMLWGAWHLIVVVWEMDSPSGSLPLMVVVPLALLCLPVFRILMVWVYEHTGSLLLAILMHASLTASSLMLAPQGAGSPF